MGGMCGDPQWRRTDQLQCIPFEHTSTRAGQLTLHRVEYTSKTHQFDTGQRGPVLDLLARCLQSPRPVARSITNILVDSIASRCYTVFLCKERAMTEAKIERLERAIWEIAQLAQELDDMGYGTFANELDVIVANVEIDLGYAMEATKCSQ